MKTEIRVFIYECTLYSLWDNAKIFGLICFITWFISLHASIVLSDVGTILIAIFYRTNDWKGNWTLLFAEVWLDSIDCYIFSIDQFSKSDLYNKSNFRIPCFNYNHVVNFLIRLFCKKNWFNKEYIIICYYWYATFDFSGTRFVFIFVLCHIAGYN